MRTRAEEEHGQVVDLVRTLDLKHKARPGIVHLLQIGLSGIGVSARRAGLACVGDAGRTRGVLRRCSRTWWVAESAMSSRASSRVRARSHPIRHRARLWPGRSSEKRPIGRDGRYMSPFPHPSSHPPPTVHAASTMYRHASALQRRLPAHTRLAVRVRPPHPCGSALIHAFPPQRYAIDSPSSRGPPTPGIPPVPPPTAHAKPVPAVVVPVRKPDVIVPEPAAAVVVKPVPVAVNPKAGGAPPPPPPPPPPPNAKPPSKFLRKLFLYLTLGTLVFYPTSAYVSLKSDKYRDFFTSTFPLAEQLIEYADDHDWDQLGAATTTRPNGAVATGKDAAAAKAQDGAKDLLVTAQHKASDFAHKIAAKADTLTQQAAKAVDDVKHQGALKVDEAKRAAGVAVKDVKRETKRDAAVVETKAAQASDAAAGEAKRVVDGLKAAAAGVTERAGHVVDEVKHEASHAVDQVKALLFSDGVTELVDRAEQALGRAGSKVERAAHDAEHKVETVAHDLAAASQAPVPAGVQAQMVDTQPKRDVVADDDGSHTASKQAYTGPALPIGFEPPPGYYVPKPAEPTTRSTEHAQLAADPLQAGLPEPKPVLPLLAPKVHEFTSAQDEPIISQLASTIDSLAESLSATSHAAASSSTTDAVSPAAILTRAQDDLASLSGRLQALKDDERRKLEETAERKRAEFEAQLRARESEWTNKEGELVEGWKEEREKLVDGWRKVLDRELEGQRVGIEQRWVPHRTSGFCPSRALTRLPGFEKRSLRRASSCNDDGSDRSRPRSRRSAAADWPSSTT